MLQGASGKNSRPFMCLSLLEKLEGSTTLSSTYKVACFSLRSSNCHILPMLECREITGMQIMLGKVSTQTNILHLGRSLKQKAHSPKHIPLLWGHADSVPAFLSVKAHWLSTLQKQAREVCVPFIVGCSCAMVHEANLLLNKKACWFHINMLSWSSHLNSKHKALRI